MNIMDLYLLSLPVGMASIWFSYMASMEPGRGKRTVLLALSYSLLMSMFMILILMLGAAGMI